MAAKTAEREFPAAVVAYGSRYRRSYEISRAEGWLGAVACVDEAIYEIFGENSPFTLAVHTTPAPEFLVWICDMLYALLLVKRKPATDIIFGLMLPSSGCR
jgi:hypothetical protein